MRRSDSGNSTSSETTLVTGVSGTKRKCEFAVPTATKRVAGPIFDHDSPFVARPLPPPEQPNVIVRDHLTVVMFNPI